MKLNDIIKRIESWYLAAIDQSRSDRVRCIYLKSAPGRGKTTTLVNAAAMLSERLGRNLGYVVINGPLLTPADAIGYLVPKHYDDHTESVYTDPFWWRTSEGKRLEEYDGGFIIVDEADKCDADVKKVIGEAALSGRLGPHKIPEGWVVWMAGNRAQDRSGSTKELDHLINRRMEIDVTDDLQSWTDWAVTNGVTPLTVAFANQNPHIVFADGVPEKQGPWCTPRSLVMADSYMQSLAGPGEDFPADSTTIEEVGGMIGAGAAAQLFSFVRLQREMPEYSAIIKEPKKVKVPEKPDAQMLVVYTLAHRVSKDDAAQVIQYVERMPKEFAVTFATAACKRDHMLVATPAFQKWALDNSSLMAAISRH